MATIGFIGLGNMGLPMAQNLIKAGHKVQGFDVTKAQADALAASGGVAAPNVRAAVTGAEIVVTMLPAGTHVREVYTGADGVLAGAGPGTLLIDSSTIDVESARAVAAAAEKKGLPMLDAPVSGGTGGAQAGYNFQYGNMVFGGEADFNAFRLHQTNTVTSYFPCCPPPGTANTYTNSVSTDWLFTARARLGFAAANWLVYGTGGLAVTRLSYAHAYIEGTAGGSGGVETSSASAVKTGYAAGGGFEHTWSRNWSVKAEYLYLGFGSISTAGTAISSTAQGSSGHVFNHTANLTANVVRVGVNYKID